MGNQKHVPLRASLLDRLVDVRGAEGKRGTPVWFERGIPKGKKEGHHPRCGLYMWNRSFGHELSENDAGGLGESRP